MEKIYQSHEISLWSVARCSGLWGASCDLGDTEICFEGKEQLARYDWEAVPKESLLYNCIRVADTDGQDFDQNLEQKMPIMSI